MRRSRIQPKPFRTIATYDTITGKQHIVQQIWGRFGYTVATRIGELVDPDSLAAYASREEAIAEIERRAQAESRQLEASHVETVR